MLGCITEREDPADALVVNAKNKVYQLDALPEGSVVGTSSLRPWPSCATTIPTWCSRTCAAT